MKPRFHNEIQSNSEMAYCLLFEAFAAVAK